MGVFAAMVLPATLAVITNLFPKPQERALAIGVWSSIAGVAVAIGPVSGGWLLEHFSWHSVFWMNVPVALVAVVLVVLIVPESKASAVGPLDVPGVILSIAGVTLLVFVVIEAPNFGWTSWRTIGGLVLAAVFLVLFVQRGDASRPRARRVALPHPSVRVAGRVDRGGILQSLRLPVPHHPVLPGVRSTHLSHSASRHCPSPPRWPSAPRCRRSSRRRSARCRFS